MSLSDLIAFPLLLVAILAGTALSIARSESGPRVLTVAYALCVRMAVAGVMLIITILMRGNETGLFALLPVFLLSLDLGWDLLVPSADHEDG